MMFVKVKNCKDKMRYPPGHKEEKRKELLAISGAALKQGGFAATGVDALMQAAGVTSGAFYSHFASKNDLLKAVITQELTNSREGWLRNPHTDAEKWLDFELERYLNLRHVRHPEAGCMLPSLGAEIARAEDAVKDLFAEEMQKGVAILAERLGSDERAWAFTCQLVGAVLMARAMPDKASQTAIIEASKSFLRAALQAAT
jgi:TetR/AcrR family transcriptional repressor of nem operon